MKYMKVLKYLFNQAKQDMKGANNPSKNLLKRIVRARLERW